jgi:hypothetical protein
MAPLPTVVAKLHVGGSVALGCTSLGEDDDPAAMRGRPVTQHAVDDSQFGPRQNSRLFNHFVE